MTLHPAPSPFLRRSRIAALTAALLALGPACAPTAPAARSAPPAPELAGVIGLSFGAGERRAIVETPPGSPHAAGALSTKSLVRIASISKLVTALGVMRLVEEDRLDLDRDVSDYLGWRLRNPAFPDRPVTLRMLLGHRSTLVDDGGYFFPLGTKLRDVVGAKSWHAGAAPGAHFGYTNLNYGVIGTVMEAATGERFDRLMQRLVLAPALGPGRACFNWSGCDAEAVASGIPLYRKGLDETAWKPEGPWIAQVDDALPPRCPVRLPAPDAACDLAAYRPGDNGTLFAPQGGLRISAEGLAALGSVLLADGVAPNGTRILSRESVRALLTPEWRWGASPAGETYAGLMRCYGPGPQCLSGEPGAPDQPLARPTRWWGHLGDAYGLYAGLWLDPEAKRGIVYFVTGTSDDPAKYPGRRSAFRAFEESVIERLAR
jgi:CubicO group peptidase (beta-lactamase class C family)